MSRGMWLPIPWGRNEGRLPESAGSRPVVAVLLGSFDSDSSARMPERKSAAPASTRDRARRPLAPWLQVLGLLALAAFFAASLVLLGQALGNRSPWLALLLMFYFLALAKFAEPLIVLRMPRSIHPEAGWRQTPALRQPGRSQGAESRRLVSGSGQVLGLSAGAGRWGEDLGGSCRTGGLRNVEEPGLDWSGWLAPSSCDWTRHPWSFVWIGPDSPRVRGGGEELPGPAREFPVPPVQADFLVDRCGDVRYQHFGRYSVVEGLRLELSALRDPVAVGSRPWRRSRLHHRGVQLLRIGGRCKGGATASSAAVHTGAWRRSVEPLSPAFNESPKHLRRAHSWIGGTKGAVASRHCLQTCSHAPQCGGARWTTLQ